MLEINVTAETAASPDRVLALAGTDFSDHRAEIWPNVTTRRLEVHERGATYAVVTEGATGIARFASERSRYDWSEPGTVTQTVLDSNVVAPGSSWQMRVAARDDGGSTVQMRLERHSGAASRAATRTCSTGLRGAAGGACSCARRSRL
jgi:hypothetical protein